MSRIIPTIRPTTCWICKQPVEQVVCLDHMALLDRLNDGRLVPHSCPEDAVRAWTLRDTVRRIVERRRAQSPADQPDNGGLMSLLEATLRDEPSPLDLMET